MKVLKANDGFLWADVTHIAESLWRSQEFELYAIYDDQSEHLIYKESEFEEAMRDKCIIAIELCPIQEIKTLNQIDAEREEKLHRETMKYPFSEGDDYWTIYEGEVTYSCWDSVSEELHDLNPNKIYFSTEKLAIDYLKQLN